MNKKQWKKMLMQAIKIAIGSCAAIYISETLNLQFATSAGSIALLTVLTTKWETLKLALFRVITFFISTALASAIFFGLNNDWGSYGIFVFLLVVICELLGLRSTVSVNAVIGTHYLTTMNFSKEFILNEFMLVLIGISISIILNLFHANDSRKKDIIKNMRDTEEGLQTALRNLAAYLRNEQLERNVWDDIRKLEKEIEHFIHDACEYQNNTFHSHPEYYIDYFEMRMKQCNVLHNLHYEIKKIRSMPEQASIVANYILYMANYVIEVNIPVLQLERLKQIFQDMKKEALPVSREEFESRAILYHILMDLEEFLIFKKRFVEELDETKKKTYWNTQTMQNE